MRRFQLLPLAVVALLAGVAFGGDPTSSCEGPAPAKAAGEEYIRVEVRGQLRHGVVAIGGETTGTDISANGVRWELDLSGNPDFAKLAEQFDGKTAVVTGTLAIRQGVEILQRWIVTVETLKAAE